MPRLRFPILIGALSLSLVVGPLSADSPSDDNKRLVSTLAVQQAMATAKQCLRDSQPKNAVDVLEEQLSKAGGHQGFLELLRDAYRDYIRKLSIDNEPAVAQKYVQRLAILDPRAARELAIPTKETPVKFEARPAPQAPVTPLPNYAASQNPQPAASAQPPKVIAASNLVKPSTVRGKMGEEQEDPFGLGNQRSPASIDAGQLATQLVSRANDEFSRRRYKEARLFYEQAFQADQQAADACRDSWAYCMLNDVVEALNRPGFGGKPLPQLQKDVHGAVAMAPKLSATGDWLLREINQRQQAQVSVPAAVQNVAVRIQHYGRNPQGWQVADTPNFRIYHNQPRDLVERVAQTAERTRLEMSRKWFGNDGDDWQGKCELVLHATAAEYSKQTGVPATSPGHSRIESDRATHRVIGRRLDLHVDNPSMVEAVLPHETTHCIIAGQFGPFPVPRWVDEGMAVLSEPAVKVEQHRRNLVKAAGEGQLFGVKELLELDNYPQPQRVGAFYAQSVGLVDFITQQQGPAVFSAFVRDGLRSGWDAALRKHYNWSLTDLQQRWDAHVQGDAQRMAAGSR